MAGMLAMIIGPRGAKQYEKETGNKLGNLEEAERMLGNREWKSLTRDEKLDIRKTTGWQIGPGGDWMFETDRDPSLSKGFERKYGTRYSYRDTEIAKTKKVADEVRRVRDSYRQLVKERGLSGNESYGEEFLPAEVLWDRPETMANHMRIWRGLLKDETHESDPVKMSFLNDKKLLEAEADLAAHVETGKGRPDFSPYEGTLGDVLDFSKTPELLVAYPGLDKIKLRIEEGEDGTLGEWNNKTKTLTMTKQALEEKGLQGSLGTLLHELTHRVQDSEGFANGGNYLSTIFNRPSKIHWSFRSPTPENLPKRPDNYFYFGGSNPAVDNPASGVDRVMEQFWNLSSRNADYAEKHPGDTVPLYSSHDFRDFIGPAWEGYRKGQYGLPDLTPLPKGNLSDPEVMNAWKEENYAAIRTALDGIMGPIRAYDSAVAHAKEAERIEKERQDAINKAILEMQKRYDTSTNAIPDEGLGKYDELYRRIAGETGARNSESRMKMTPEERMGSLLEDTEDRKRAEQIDSRFGFGNAIDPDSFDKTLREHPRMLQQASKGGNAPGESKSSGVPSGHNPALDGYSGPKIMINPSTFRNEKDALCVAWNEAIRVFMEANGYEPQSEPTEAQRRFFADTPYADDELQLRRTIIARICVFDTSVKDPTDDQLSESASVLRAIIDSGFAKTDDEITKCERLARAIEAAVGAEPVEPKEEPLEARPLRPNEETQAAIDAGVPKFDEEEDKETDPVAQIQEETAKDFQEGVSQDVQSAIVDQQLAQNAGGSQPGDIDTSHIKYGPQEAKTPTMDDVGKAVAAGQPAAPAQQAPAQEQPVQQVAAAAPQQEVLAPGLSRSGSRNNILEFNGRRISQREFDRIQAKFQEGGGAQQPQAAAPQPVQQAAAQPVQVAANDEDPLKPNNLRQNTQVDSGRRDALGRPLDDRGRVIA